ncbi:MAG: hypothetical protein DMG97_34315 [Acidobacteria bacterium]|nr:MAG: hypothetical protein DMG97_34315 [Acidobacteriota bacterium]
MEAMAFGKPVITTRHVEIPRIIKRIVVDENDVQGLAVAIQQVYGSASLRDELGVNNRRIAEQVFSSNNAARSAALLRQVIDRNKGKQADQSAPILQEEDAADVSRA